MKTSMILNKAATLTKGFAAALLGTFFLAGCDQLGDLDGVMPGGGSGGNNSKMKMYKVQLNPLNNSGVYGTATVMMTENGEFEVITDVKGLAPHME
ncbi:hypothetical protein, partial [Pontibacter pamirensis]|uniref:hypothetical protein n=1 Tax=Pontibacter pamirensis TaxID=2562824 RepID=UPI00138A094F